MSLVGNTVDLGAWKYTLKETNGRYDLYNPEVEKRNQTVDTPSITTPNNIQADVPSVPSNNEEIARVEAPVPPPAPATPSETTKTVAENSKQESKTIAKNEQDATETRSQNDEVAKEAKPSVEANPQTNEVAQSGSKTEETQTTETKETAKVEKEKTAKVEREKTQEPPKATSQASPKQEQSETVQPQAVLESENVPTVNNAKEVQAQLQTQPSATVSTEQPAPENSINTRSATAIKETAEKSDKPKTETVATTEDDRQPEANTVADNSVANNSASVKATENSSTKAEQPVTASTTVNTGNSVVENPENTTQPAVNSESSKPNRRSRRSVSSVPHNVQPETATTETVSQPKVTSTDETTATSTNETTVADNSESSNKPKSRRKRSISQPQETSTDETTITDNSESNKTNTRRRSRSRRSVHSVPHNVKSATTSSNGRSAVAELRDLTSTNTNAVISDAMAKAQFVALNVGKAVSQHISQLEMNNEGQYNIWVSNTSMNENYSSSQYRRFSSKSTQTQLGWDQTISNNVQLGGVFTYVRNSNNFDKATSKNTLAQVNFYSKYYADNHWYLGIDLGYGKFQSNLQTNNNAKFARHTAQFGLTAGKAFNLGNFGITPIVGVRYSYLSNANFALDQDRIKVNPISVKTAFAQVDLSYTYHLGEFSVTPILSARYDANQGSGKINVTRYDFAYNVENQQQYNAGLKLKYHNVKLSLIGGLTKAKQAEKQKTAELKLSFSF